MKKHIVFDCDGTLIDTSVPRYQLFEGIRELLQALSQDHFLYVWTARDRRSTLRIFEEQGLNAYFQDICTANDALLKPHTEGLSQLLGDTDKNLIYIIGDSSSDMLGAKSFGVYAIGAVWNPLASNKALMEAGADFIATHPSICSKLVQLNLKSFDF